MIRFIIIISGKSKFNKYKRDANPNIYFKNVNAPPTLVTITSLYTIRE